MHSHGHHLDFHSKKKKKKKVSNFFHGKFFSSDFRYSFPRESSFPRQIPGSVKRSMAKAVMEPRTADEAVVLGVAKAGRGSMGEEGRGWGVGTSYYKAWNY